MKFVPSSELRDIVSEEEYQDRPCIGANPDIFFPIEQEDIRSLGNNVISFPDMKERARAICNGCLSSWLCYLAADLKGTTDGIFGGVDFSHFDEVD